MRESQINCNKLAGAVRANANASRPSYVEHCTVRMLINICMQLSAGTHLSPTVLPNQANQCELRRSRCTYPARSDVLHVPVWYFCSGYRDQSQDGGIPERIRVSAHSIRNRNRRTVNSICCICSLFPVRTQVGGGSNRMHVAHLQKIYFKQIYPHRVGCSKQRVGVSSFRSRRRFSVYIADTICVYIMRSHARAVHICC